MGAAESLDGGVLPLDRGGSFHLSRGPPMYMSTSGGGGSPLEWPPADNATLKQKHGHASLSSDTWALMRLAAQWRSQLHKHL